MQLSEDKNRLRKSVGLTFRKDSSKANYSVQLWPKGNFTFSPENGFSGEAEKIVITGDHKSNSLSSGATYKEDLDKGKTSAHLSQKKKDVEDHGTKVKTTSPSWKWIAGGIFLVMISGWIIYKKLTKI